jgi:TetR/AcrR family transcriptional regulator, mexJK operon transcriptional repressor
MEGLILATKMIEVADGKKVPKVVRKRVYHRKADVVLEAAEKAFLQNGFAATSMDAIAEQAGVSKRTVYSNFGSKQELFEAVVKRRCASVIPNQPGEEDFETSDPEALLIGLATDFLTNIFADHQVELYRMIVADSRQFPEIGKLMFEGPILESQSIFEEFIRRQADAGRFAISDPQMAAAQLVSMLKTNVQMRLLFNQSANTSPRAIAASAAASIRLFLHGALPR